MDDSRDLPVMTAEESFSLNPVLRGPLLVCGSGLFLIASIAFLGLALGTEKSVPIGVWAYFGIICAGGILLVCDVLRWLWLVDHVGVHRQHALGRVTWTWEDFGSGRVSWSRSAFHDRHRRFGRRSFSLMFLSDDDRLRLRARIRPHWVPAPAAEPPERIVMKGDFWRTWKLVFHDAGIELRQWRKKTSYTWDQVECVRSLKPDHEDPAFVSCRIHFPGRAIELRQLPRRNWSGAKAATIAAFLRKHVAADRLVVFSPEKLPDAVEDCEQSLRWVCSRRRALTFLRWFYPLFGLAMAGFVFSLALKMPGSYPDLALDIMFPVLPSLGFCLLTALMFQFFSLMLPTTQLDGLAHRLEEQRTRVSGSPIPSPPTRRPSRIPQAIGALTLCLVGVMLGGLAWATGQYAVAAREAKTMVRAIESRGEPVSVESLKATYYDLGEEENAAALYLQAFALVRPLPPDVRELLDEIMCWDVCDTAAPLPADMKEAMRQHVTDNARAVEALRQTMGAGQCRYPLEFSEGLAMKEPHLRLASEAADLLLLKALLQAEAGEPARAVETLLNGLALARSLDAEPTAAGQLGRLRILCGVCLGCAHLLNRCPLLPAELEQLSQALADREGSEGLARLFVGERCLTLRTIDSECGTSLTALHKLPFLIGMERFIDAARKPFSEGLPEALQLGAELEEIYQQSADPRPHAVLGPPLSRAFEAAARRTAWLRCTQTALAIARYREFHGKRPSSLEELTPKFLPEVPVDPFGGHPLRYEEMGEGYRVYSVGSDGQVYDDQKTPLDENDDIVFSVRRPTSRRGRRIAPAGL